MESKFFLSFVETFYKTFITPIFYRKFDIGIYVIMTSVNPLRVYTFNTDVLLRFCAKKYLPFNSSDLDSYVVGDDYTPIWEVFLEKFRFIAKFLENN